MNRQAWKGDPEGQTAEELSGMYVEIETAAQAIEEIARRGYEVDVEHCKASGLVEVQAQAPPESVEDLAGLYATFENAADAIARLARHGLETEVDVHHPTGRTSGPTIEVRIAGALDELAPTAGVSA